MVFPSTVTIFSNIVCSAKTQKREKMPLDKKSMVQVHGGAKASAEEGRYNTFFLKKEPVLRKDENRNMDK